MEEKLKKEMRKELYRIRIEIKALLKPKKQKEVKT
jgi:hypothetical protein